MSLRAEIFEQGLTWHDWLAGMDAEWRERYERAQLGELEGEFRGVAGSARILCLLDPDSLDCRWSVPYIARAVEAVPAGSIELRLFHGPAERDLRREVLGTHPFARPLVLIYDEEWAASGRWGPRPSAARRLLAYRQGRTSPELLLQELETWYAADAGRSTLREFLVALRGEPTETRVPWTNLRHHLWRQVERAQRD